MIVGSGYVTARVFVSYMCMLRTAWLYQAQVPWHCDWSVTKILILITDPVITKDFGTNVEWFCKSRLLKEKPRLVSSFVAVVVVVVIVCVTVCLSTSWWTFGRYIGMTVAFGVLKNILYFDHKNKSPFCHLSGSAMDCCSDHMTVRLVQTHRVGEVPVSRSDTVCCTWLLLCTPCRRYITPGN